MNQCRCYIIGDMNRLGMNQCRCCICTYAIFFELPKPDSLNITDSDGSMPGTIPSVGRIRDEMSTCNIDPRSLKATKD